MVHKFIKKMSLIFQTNIIYIFLFSIFLIKAPPFYYSSLQNRIFSSHSLAKIIIIIISAFLLITKNKQIKNLIKNNQILFLILYLYFLSQSLSVIMTKNIIEFWRSYHNIIIFLLIFCITFLINNINKKFVRKTENFIIISGIILISIEAVIFLLHDYLMPYLNLFIQKEVMDAYLTNINRGRNSLDLNIEIFLPFFLLGIVLHKKNKNFKIKKAVLFIFSFILIYLSFLSNYRSRVVALIFIIVFFSYLFLIKLRTINTITIRTKWKKMFLFFSFSIIIGVFLALLTSNRIFSFNVVNRFLMEDQYEDLGTVNFRIDSFYNSINLFKSSPIFGTGLGNYFNDKILEGKRGFYLINQRYKIDYKDYVANSPHNIFLQVLSETGLIGIVFFSILLIYFIMRDVLFIKNKKLHFISACIISSWSIIIYVLFGPANTIFVMGWFWFLRGIIESNYSIA